MKKVWRIALRAATIGRQAKDATKFEWAHSSRWAGGLSHKSLYFVEMIETRREEHRRKMCLGNGSAISVRVPEETTKSCFGSYRTAPRQANVHYRYALTSMGRRTVGKPEMALLISTSVVRRFSRTRQSRTSCACAPTLAACDAMRCIAVQSTVRENRERGSHRSTHRYHQNEGNQQKMLYRRDKKISTQGRSPLNLR